MAIQSGRKQATVSNIPIKFKPFIKDFTEIDRMATAEGTDRPTVTRILISERLKQMRLESVGKDVTTQAVVEVQKRAMTDAMAPVVALLEKLIKQQERLEARVAD